LDSWKENKIDIYSLPECSFDFNREVKIMIRTVAGLKKALNKALAGLSDNTPVVLQGDQGEEAILRLFVSKWRSADPDKQYLNDIARQEIEETVPGAKFKRLPHPVLVIELDF